MQSLYHDLTRLLPDCPCRLLSDTIEIDIGKTFVIGKGQDFYRFGIFPCRYEDIPEKCQIILQEYRYLREIKKMLRSLLKIFEIPINFNLVGNTYYLSFQFQGISYSVHQYKQSGENLNVVVDLPDKGIVATNRQHVISILRNTCLNRYPTVKRFFI